MKNFWKTLQKPILVLAPMENVTDTVFRRIVSYCGKPSVFFTEFTNTDGMTHAKGRSRVDHRLIYTEEERPIVAQIWGTEPENFYKTAQIVVEKGFDGVDINMGCPVRGVVRRGACSGLIKDPKRAAEIIQATREGVNATARPIPVSVKTRIGFSGIITDEWVRFLLEQEIDALTLHLRTSKELSKVAAHWDEMEKAVLARKELKKDTIIIGNGDIKTLQEIKEKVDTYGIDGAMVGRGIFENIWLFNDKRNPETISAKEKLELLIRHVKLYESTWGDSKRFPVLRKFVKAYVNGFNHATDLRVKLMETETSAELVHEVEKILTRFSTGDLQE